MKTFRVTIKHTAGKQTNLLSTTVPAISEKEAIEKIISANNLDGKVVSKKAELLKIN